MSGVKTFLQLVLDKIGLQVSSTERYKKLNEISIANSFNYKTLLIRILTLLPIIEKIDESHFSDLIETLKMSKSQLGQDVFALSVLNFKRNGFFVEFGATNGIDYSNSLVIEKIFGWKGIFLSQQKLGIGIYI